MKKKGLSKRSVIAAGKKQISIAGRGKNIKKASQLLLKKSGTDKKPGSDKSTQQKKEEGIKPFPVVGIGASAGGLEAFSSLLHHLPVNLGMAYVYIQHLSPKHESFLPEILQRKTKMKVHKVKDNMPLEKDNVYVIPVKHYITITDGKLKLTPQAKGSNVHSIDYFLTSLAPVYKQNAIGIVLSGTGTDGTLGLMSIKAEGGISFAQDDTAHYTGMPQHAADMGYVDFVMPPDKIANELASLIKHPYSVTTQNDFFQDNKNELRKIHMLMNSKRGVDFSHYKESTINRRIMRRMVLNRLKELEDYYQFLKESKTEADALYHDLLITVTNFFRDSSVFHALTNKILPVLLKNRKPGDPLRIWIPGCATGEEAVSFAITILEYLGEKAITTPIQIFATDLNGKAIERARSGLYLKNALENVSTQRLKRFFTKLNGGYQVVKTIRDMCVFAPHNLLKDPPFSKMDVISCQNVLIYIKSVPQNKIMHAFHYALKPTGYLLLGRSESIGSATDLFDHFNKQYKIYTKKLVNAPLHLDFIMHDYPRIEIPGEVEKQHKTFIKETDLEKETDKLLLSRYVPASVLVNKDLEIVRFRGSTSRFLEPASGKASLQLLKMIKEELAFDLRWVIQRVKKDGRPVKKEGIVFGVNGGTQEIAIEVLPVKNQGKDFYYLIIFQENGIAHTAIKGNGKMPAGRNRGSAAKRIISLEAQLQDARESTKVITEEAEATREELQSANEEILSSNEELQSINEELETSKEELQSTNEELTTINEELQVRNSELKEAGDYTRAIIETMHESLLMLYPDLKIRNANKGFYQTFQITSGETEGQYLYQLSHHEWDIPELRKQLSFVQTRNISIINFEITHEFPNLGRKNLLLNSLRFPIKDSNESMILLAIQDITERKKMEETLRDSEERFRLLVQNSSDVITVFDKDGTIKFESPAIELVLGYKTEERVGRNISVDPIVHPEDRKTKLDLLQRSADNPRRNVAGEFRLRHKNGNYRTIEAIFRNLLDDPKIDGIIANYRDITDRKALEQQKDEFIGIASHELKTPVTSIKAYSQILQDVFLKAHDKKSVEFLHKMEGQVDRLNILIVDLLDFTRIEGGKLKFREEDYTMNELVREMVEDMQRTSKTHKIILKLDKEAKMYGDRYRVGQVITNIISNAIKYSPNAKKIVITSKTTDENVTVCVQDFGVGIRTELVGKVFDKFFRVTEPVLNTFPGLGLGLYIAAEIVQRQGGRIWAKSVEGKGSAFCFLLPVKK